MTFHFQNSKHENTLKGRNFDMQQIIIYAVGENILKKIEKFQNTPSANLSPSFRDFEVKQGLLEHVVGAGHQSLESSYQESRKSLECINKYFTFTQVFVAKTSDEKESVILWCHKSTFNSSRLEKTPICILDPYAVIRKLEA